MFGIGREVAYRGETQSCNHGIAHGVNVFVNLSRLKPSVEMDVSVAGNKFSINRARELPRSSDGHASAKYPYR